MSKPGDTGGYAIAANKTDVATTKTRNKAIVPQYVKGMATTSDSILDFGSGKYAVHTYLLRDLGYDCTAHGFGRNLLHGIHGKDALDYEYDIVFASNVLNVQGNMAMLKETLRQISASLICGGVFICDYPASPRKMSGVSGRRIEKILNQYFDQVDIEEGGYSRPVFFCYG